MLFGSCRTAAPHEPPWSLEPATDRRGRGVDALRAHAMRMSPSPPTSGPTSSCSSATRSTPTTRRRRPGSASEQRDDDSDAAARDASPTSRSTPGCTTSRGSPRSSDGSSRSCPSAMIFDDHDMIDDWNISAAWVADIRRQAVVAGARRRRARVVLDLPAPRQPRARRDPRRGDARRAARQAPTAGRCCASGRAVRGVHARARRLPVQLLPRPRPRAPRRDRLPATGGCSSRAIAPMLDDGRVGMGGRAVPRRPVDHLLHRHVAAGVRPRGPARPPGVERSGVRRQRGGGSPARARRAPPARHRPGGLAGVPAARSTRSSSCSPRSAGAPADGSARRRPSPCCRATSTSATWPTSLSARDPMASRRAPGRQLTHPQRPHRPAAVRPCAPPSAGSAR